MLVACDNERLGTLESTEEGRKEGDTEDSSEGDTLACVFRSVGAVDDTTVGDKLTGTLLGW